MIEQQKHRDRILHNILTTDPDNNFIAGGVTKVLEKPLAPLCEGDPYMDAWANPLLQRGIPEDQKQLHESSFNRKALFTKHPKVPYYTAAGGNRNSVLPNGLFDVIAEAEVTGGLTQRHKGDTAKFGLPAGADHRTRSGCLPTPPIRATAMRPPAYVLCNCYCFCHVA